MTHYTLTEQELRKWERIDLAIDIITWSIVGALAVWVVSNF